LKVTSRSFFGPVAPTVSTTPAPSPPPSSTSDPSNNFRQLALASSACYLTPRILASAFSTSARQRKHLYSYYNPHSSSFMRRPTLAAPFLITVAAFLSTGNGPTGRTTRTFSDAASTHMGGSQRKDEGGNDCPFYGCPLHPVDVHYNTEPLKAILQNMRDIPAEKVDAEVLKGDSQTSGWNRRDAATLTLIGYKGGPVLQQINQDRAVVVSPFFAQVLDEDKENEKPNGGETKVDQSLHHKERILLGVFDGHAARGEIVSEYTVQTLPSTLAKKLADLPSDTEQPAEREASTIRALHESFVEMDTTAPADPSGGCTATVILRQDEKIYVANAGDSRSFVVAYRPSTKKVHLVYISREDKPSLPDEKARVESMGGQVYIPMRGTSRVVYHDPITGSPSGLAMSRSIGDWAAGKLGVIPDPIVDVMEIPQIVEAVIKNETTASGANDDCYVVDEAGELDTSSCSDERKALLEEQSNNSQKDDVYIFGVSATDGLMDYLAAEEIAKVLASALFDSGATHPVTACELLIFSAANGWQQDKQGRYRDDIAIAVSALRRPPTKE